MTKIPVLRGILASGIAVVLLGSVACTSEEKPPPTPDPSTAMPTQTPTENNAVDVCHRWSLSLLDDPSPILTSPEEYGGQTGKASGLIYLKTFANLAACTGVHHSDPTVYFAEATRSILEEGDVDHEIFLDTLAGFFGPEGFAATWNSAIRHDGDRDDTSEGSLAVSEIDWEELNTELQEELGLAIAELSRPWNDSVRPGEFAEAWTNLGGQTIQTRTYAWDPDIFATVPNDEYDWTVIAEGPQVYGWSIMAPLLRFGDFHEDFLTPVATAIVEFDQAHEGDWLIEGEDAISFDMFDDDPADAMDAVLEALARNPAAAQEVYSATGDERIGDLISGD